MNNPESKKCIICGNEFIPRQKNYICCSKECSRERKRRYSKLTYETYYKGNKEYVREMYNRRKLIHSVIIPCKICGKNVPDVWTGNRIGRKRYHDQCVLDEARKAYSEVGSWDKRKDSRIRQKLWEERFWSQSFCLLTTGGAPIEVIKKYIEGQGQNDRRRK